MHGLIQKSSYVVISEVLAHNSTTVFGIIQKLLPLLTENLPVRPTCCHYYTDSPTSQYRNKAIFRVIAKHQELFGMKATWSYFEAGHGKGPCDGLGGTIKRLADDAIKREVAIIQDANEFYAWATTLKSEMSFLFLTKEECEAAKVALEELCASTRTIQGTMMIHAVSYASASTDGVGIMVRNTSCFCQRCLSGGEMVCRCEGWTERVTESRPNNDDSTPQPGAAVEEAASHTQSSKKIGQRTAKKTAAKKCPCAKCGWNYGDGKDPKKMEDWLSCVGCHKWLHESCAEECGVIDDTEEFTCEKCL